LPTIQELKPYLMNYDLMSSSSLFVVELRIAH